MKAKLAAEQRVAILVDSENLEISVTDYHNPRSPKKSSSVAYPNWKKILPNILKKRLLVRNIYYKKQGLLISEKFRKFWMEELSGEIRQPKKSVDPYIIVDAITLSKKVDVVVILAGDKDYLPLVWLLKSSGCKVEIAAFPDAAAFEIIRAADTFYPLSREHVVYIKKT